MKKARPRAILQALVALALSVAPWWVGPGAAGPREAIGEDVEVELLAEGVWLHVSFQDLEGFGRVPANGLLVVSEGQVALLDTPWTDAQTRALTAWAEERLEARLTVVVPTHSHADCMGGLAAAHALGARSIAHATTVAFAERDGLPIPQESFERQHDIPLGSRVLQARFVGPGHTADTVVVWLPDHRILFGGDLVRAASSRSLGYTREAKLDAWPVSIKALTEAYGDARWIVPGHGAPGRRELLDRTLELLAAPR